MAKFEECLGRVMYVTGALEHVYKFMTIHPRHSVQAVPSYVAFFLRFLAGQVEQRRHTTRARCRPFRRQQPREWMHRRRQSGQESEAGFRQSVRTAHWTCGRLGGSVWN